MTVPLATPEDVGVLLQRDLADPETEAARLLIDLVTSEIEDALGITFAGASRIITLPGTWDRTIDIPGDVTSIQTISINGIALATGAWYWNTGRIVRRGPNPAEEYALAIDEGGYVRQGAIPTVSDFHWGGPSSSITIAYTAPNAVAPTWLKGMCANVVMREMSNPTQVQSESLGAYSVRYSQKGGSSTGIMSGDQRSELARRYRRNVGTIVPAVR